MIKNNNHRLKDKKKTLIFANNMLKILRKNIKRLKLGKVLFEFKQIIYADITIHEEVEIRYVRQDTTRDDELKIETRLKALDWQWNFSNVMAFLIIALLAGLLLYAFIYVWYCNNLPSLAYRDPRYDELIRFSLNIAFSGPQIGIFKTLSFANFILISNIVDLCSNFGMIF